MIPARSFANSDVAVFGLARSGISSVVGLKAGGARVVAWDDNEAARIAAERVGARVLPFGEWNWDRIKALVLSPGIALTHPVPHEVVTRAHAAGVEIIGDIELFAREIRPDPMKSGRAPVVAVTGTNGKSTTTALIGHILASCGYAAEIGGNIGRPVLDLAAPNGRTIYVLEMSSYQIDLAPGLRARRVGVDQHRARSHRPARFDGPLCRGQGAAPRANCKKRPDHHWRRRFLFALRSSPALPRKAARKRCPFPSARCWAGAFSRSTARCTTPGVRARRVQWICRRRHICPARIIGRTPRSLTRRRVPS